MSEKCFSHKNVRRAYYKTDSPQKRKIETRDIEKQHRYTIGSQWCEEATKILPTEKSEDALITRQIHQKKQKKQDIENNPSLKRIF